jgi:hypothetical protein
VRVLGQAGGPTARAVHALLARFDLRLQQAATGALLAGSYWGEPEAGLVGAQLNARADTPLHSVLHEACHFICMDRRRRAGLHTDAGGEPLEECAVCYLSILLADALPGFGRARMLADMDAWGYSFRLGGARAWFERDAADARAWLQAEGLIDAAGAVCWRVRGGHAA